MTNRASFLELDDNVPDQNDSPAAHGSRKQDPRVHSERISAQPVIGTKHVGLSLGKDGELLTTVRGGDTQPRRGEEGLHKYLQHEMGEASDFSFQTIKGAQIVTLKVRYRHLGNVPGAMKGQFLSQEFHIPKGARKLKDIFMSTLAKVLPTSASVITPEKQKALQHFFATYERTIPLNEADALQPPKVRVIERLSGHIGTSFREILERVHKPEVGIPQTRQKAQKTNSTAIIPTVIPVIPSKSESPNNETLNTEKNIVIQVTAQEVNSKEPLAKEPVNKTEVALPSKQIAEFQRVVSNVESAVEHEETSQIQPMSGLGQSFMTHIVQNAKMFFVRKKVDDKTLLLATDPLRSKMNPWLAKATTAEQDIVQPLLKRISDIFSLSARRGKEAELKTTAFKADRRMQLFSQAKSRFFSLLDGVVFKNRRVLDHTVISEKSRFEDTAKSMPSVAYVNGESVKRPTEPSASAMHQMGKKPFATSEIASPEPNLIEKAKGGWQRFSRWTKSLFVPR